MKPEIFSFHELPPEITEPIENLLNHDPIFQIRVIHPGLPADQQFTWKQFEHLDPDLQIFVEPLIRFISLPTVEYLNPDRTLIDVPPRQLEAQIDAIDQAARERLPVPDRPVFDQIIRHNKLRLNHLSTVTTYLTMLPPDWGYEADALALLQKLENYKDYPRPQKDTLVNTLHLLSVSVLTKLKNLS